MLIPSKEYSALALKHIDMRNQFGVECVGSWILCLRDLGFQVQDLRSRVQCLGFTMI